MTFIKSNDIKKIIFILSPLLVYIIINFEFMYVKLVGPSIITLLIFVLNKPKFLLSPLNVFFAFYGLYYILPSSIYVIYEIYEIRYVLPWGKLYSWTEIDSDVIFGAFLLFYLPFLIYYVNNHYFFNKSFFYNSPNFNYIISVKLIYIVFILLLLLMLLFIQLTGGLSSWIYDYQTTYLLNRQGYGALNFLIINIGNLFVFICGLYIYNQRIKKWSVNKYFVLLIVFFVILLMSYLHGIKSRFIFLMLILFSFWLIHLKLNYRRLFSYTFAFFGIIIVGNYFRSDGYYSEFSLITEYMMSYFNVYPLHNLIINDYDIGLGESLFNFLYKPLSYFDLYLENNFHDLSVMLTIQYFPEQWYDLRATQQWPLLTDLYFTYYGFLFGIVPIVIYVSLISFLFKKSLSGKYEYLIIFIPELLRVFTTLRSVFIPWDLPVILFFYFINFYFIRSLRIEKFNS